MALKVVANDTPYIVLNLTDRFGKVIDISDAGTTVTLKVRVTGSATVKASVTCTKTPGLEDENGNIDTAAPYDVDGAGGRCVAECDATVFDAAGNYEAEIEVSYNGGAQISTVYKTLQIEARADY